MPLTAKGNKIMSRMREEYGSKKGTGVFYASRNKGIIKDVDPESSNHEKHKKIIHARRAMEDTLREQEDALLGDTDRDASSEPDSDADDRKHGKLRKR